MGRLQTIVFGVATALALPAFGAVLNPIATTGHDQDIVVEAGLNVGDPATVGELGSRQFYEQGISTQTGAHKAGLTQSVTGFVSTLTGDVINYDFQPFEQNNIIKLDTTTAATKTLTLVTPTALSQVAVVLSGGSLASGEFPSIAFTIHYQGGGAQTGSISVGDWGNVPLPTGTETLVNVGRINMSAGAAATWNNQVPETDATGGRWSVDLTEITTNSTADILSIDFGPVTLNAGPLNAGDDVVIYGIAGAAVPEPAALALLSLGGVALFRRRR